MYRKTAALGLVAALVCTPALARSPPQWLQPLPGTHAILGDDGGGDDHVTMCDTVDHYRAWINNGGLETAGCSRFLHGQRVIIKEVVFDPAKDRDPGQDYGHAIARISIPARHVEGYVQMLGGIRPIVPRGLPPLDEAKDSFDGSIVDAEKPADHDMTKVYTLDETERAFTSQRTCVQTEGQAPFATLPEMTWKLFYDFPAGTRVKVIEDNAATGFVVISDEDGHRGCVAAMAVPGYVVP